ncbi:helix-turn-helix domain-containing protein [Catenuloplanes japonicus]|uniref:helix-turn-helix domain-containing protein n=1 Tax=Catenuloplanes japonicus TaxID=33876 RepID=UPI0018DD165A|nr:helix-turn-helix domain-containing protein [Catenuloplanes japonicus]
MRRRARPDGTATTIRRTPGLRREELAERAGISVDYVVRLEQGRALNPSATVVAALAEALTLDPGGRTLLYHAAGLGSSSTAIDRTVPPEAVRLLDRFARLPAAVFSADWWLLHWNAGWSTLLGDPAPDGDRLRNLVWQVFSSAQWRPRPADRPLPEFQRALVGDLWRLAVEHPADTRLGELVAGLRQLSPVFEVMWSEGNTVRYVSEPKLVSHPTAGTMRLDCDVLGLPGSRARLLVYSAEPGSADESRLAGCLPG